MCVKRRTKIVKVFVHFVTIYTYIIKREKKNTAEYLFCSGNFTALGIFYTLTISRFMSKEKYLIDRKLFVNK